MTETNTRFEAIDGTTQLQVLAPETYIIWDPFTDGGRIIFKTARYVVVDGVIRDDIPGIPGESLEANFQDILSRCFALPGTLDPATGVPLDQVSGAGVMDIMKAALNTLHNEKFVEVYFPTL